MILSIESSCDDSAIAISEIATNKLVFHKKISQELKHSKHGGVVPELATRLHLKALPNILKQCKPYFKNLKAVCVTSNPGLNMTLTQGIMMAKAIAISLNIKFIKTNHLSGHIYSLFIGKKSTLVSVKNSLCVLLISGGHTQIINASGYKNNKILANTSDDSFGESFDKVAKMLELGYPGGVVIENLAKKGDDDFFNFTLPMSKSKQYKKLEFSFSGLKNAVRMQIEELKKNNSFSEQNICNLCASFQKIATLHLLQKTKLLFFLMQNNNKHIKNFAIVGGASANLYVRNKFKILCNEFDINIYFASLEYCSDNGAMIGRVGIEQYKNKDFSNV
jgi:N6-L-threonylcarbamoyladenine synthase